jgi:hypothetical protein
VAGGFDGRDALESVEILDIVAGKWSLGASMPLSHKQYKLSTMHSHWKHVVPDGWF